MTLKPCRWRRTKATAARMSRKEAAGRWGMATPRQTHRFAARFVAQEKHRNYGYLIYWSEWQDSNLRPLRPERSEFLLSY